MAKPPNLVFIPDQEISYFKIEVESGNNDRAKRALQSLCKRYWDGLLVDPKSITSVEQTILGVLSSGASDEKVRRWALSALSRLGRLKYSWNAVVSTIKNYQHEPQVLSAGIAALYRLSKQEADQALAAMGDISPTMIAVSALQTVSPKHLDLRGLRIDYEKDNDPILPKLGLVLLGLGKAPEHLFHPRFGNKKMVKTISRVEDPILSQYAVWAIAENPLYTASDIGLDLRILDSKPPNVRGYVYRLFGSETAYSKKGHEVIEQGSCDPDQEARLGLAIGLGETYYDGLEGIVLDWLLRNEDDETIRFYLLDHIIKQSGKNSDYRRVAIELFNSHKVDEAYRSRMLSAASRTDLFREFKSIIHQDEEGFFPSLTRGNIVNNNNTFNNYGSMQGQTSLSGTATNEGQQSNVLNQHEKETVRLTLESAIKDLRSDDSIEGKDSVIEALEVAKVDPNKDTLGRAVDAIKKIEPATEALAASSGNVVKIAAAVSGLLGYF